MCRRVGAALLVEEGLNRSTRQTCRPAPRTESAARKAVSATFALVTVVGGMTIGIFTSVTICQTLMPPISRNSPTSPRITLKTAPRTRFFGGGAAGAELGYLRESRFVCMSEEEPPKLAHYFKLTFATFRSGHLRVL